MGFIYVFFIKVVVHRTLPLNSIFNSKFCRFIHLIFFHGYLVNQFTCINTKNNSRISLWCGIHVLSSEVKVSDPLRQGLEVIDFKTNIVYFSSTDIEFSFQFIAIMSSLVLRADDGFNGTITIFN